MPLKPNSRGILVNKNEVIKTGGRITPYRTPTMGLKKIDRLRTGAPPLICISRKQGGIGDVLMTLPTVKAIAKKYGVKVHYATDFDYLDGALPKVLQGNPYISEVLPWRSVTPDQYDAIIELTCPCVEHEVPKAPPVNRVDLFARHAGIHLDDHDIDYVVSPEEKIWAQEYLYDHGLAHNKLIIVQSSASTTTRDCPVALLQRSLANILMLKREYRALIITHRSDNVRTEWNLNHAHILDNLDVRQISALIPHTDLVICPDSAVLHLAAAHHHPTLTLFGPTDPRARVNYHPEAVAIWPAGQLNNYPCVGPNSLVKTLQGYKEIIQIQVDDIVKVANGDYKRVTQTHRNKLEGRKLHELVVFGSSHRPIQVTEDHKFLVSRRYNKSKGFWKRSYIPKPEWVPAAEIEEKDYMCIPRNRAQIQKGSSQYLPEECWLFGLFLAEGYLKEATNGAKQIILSGSIEEPHVDEQLQRCLSKIGIFHYQKEVVRRKQPLTLCQDNQKAINRIITNKRLFGRMVELFGLHTTAHTKRFPPELCGLDDDCLAALLDGLFKGDGYEHHRKNTKYQVLSTVSLELAYGAQELLTRFGHLGKVYKYQRDTNLKKGVHIYRVNVCLNGKHSRHIVDDDYIYVPVKTNRMLNDIPYVYDITVEENPTFTVNNLATFDCWYENPNDGYLCWKMIEEKVIVKTAVSMLDHKPLPFPRDVVTFGNFDQENQYYQTL